MTGGEGRRGRRLATGHPALAWGLSHAHSTVPLELDFQGDGTFVRGSGLTSCPTYRQLWTPGEELRAAGEGRPVGAVGSLHTGFQSSMATAVLWDGEKEEENAAT